jgi:hypothetical protein
MVLFFVFWFSILASVIADPLLLPNYVGLDLAFILLVLSIVIAFTFLPIWVFQLGDK